MVDVACRAHAHGSACLPGNAVLLLYHSLADLVEHSSSEQQLLDTLRYLRLVHTYPLISLFCSERRRGKRTIRYTTMTAYLKDMEL